ncbi:MAG: O-antigen ligase family protein, partial [Planctomycetota bacterium]
MVKPSRSGNTDEEQHGGIRPCGETAAATSLHAPAGLAVALAQAALLVALVAVPLLANPHSSRGFQEDRTIVLRLLGTLGFAVLLFRAVPLRQLGLPGLGAGLYLFVSALSAAFSLEPIAAWPGAYLRQGGFQTDLGLAGLFLAASTLAASPGRTELALRMLLLSGVASSLLALAQAAGLDVPFASEGSRAFAFTGGPTFLGSLLAILLPVSLARVRGIGGLPIPLLLAAGLLSTASRVALVAALVGSALVGIWSGRRRLVLVTGAALLGISLLLCTPFVRGVLPADSLPNRLVSHAFGEQVSERSLIYRDALAGLRKRPDRLLLGRGPDSIGTLFTAEISEELQGRVGGRTRIDRLHSDPLDLIYTRGLLAPIALLLMIVGALLAARRRLRRATGGDRAATIGLAACLVTNFLDGALSVPGSGSRLLLFFAAGWLAGRSLPSLPRESPGRLPSSLLPGILVGAGLAVILFGTNDPRHLWVGLPLLLLLPGRPDRMRALFAAGAVLFPFLLLHLSLDPGGGGEHGSLPATLADRGRLATGSLVLLLGLITLVLAAILHERRCPSRFSARIFRASLAMVGLLLFTVQARYDVARLIADVSARVALDIQLRGGDPARAEALLEEAIELAPEVAE